MTLKIAVVAPMPNASVRTVIAENPGLRRNVRMAKRRSCRSASMTWAVSAVPRVGAGDDGRSLYLRPRAHQGYDTARQGNLTGRTPPGLDRGMGRITHHDRQGFAGARRRHPRV